MNKQTETVDHVYYHCKKEEVPHAMRDHEAQFPADTSKLNVQGDDYYYKGPGRLRENHDIHHPGM